MEVCGRNDHYLFQLEKCPSTGKLHWQGMIYFANGRTFEHVRNLLPGFHIEKAKKPAALKRYCSKVDTFAGERYSNMDGFKPPKPVFDVMKEVDWYAWQVFALDIVKAYDPHETRLIYWFWESTGRTGKSSFVKHLVMNYDAMIFGGGKRDMLNQVAEFKNKTGGTPQLLCVDLDRKSEGNTCFYSSLETLKNMCFYSPKYEGSKVTGDCPTILVFANWPPHWDYLSRDRWVVKELNEQGGWKDTPWGTGERIDESAFDT